MNSEEKYKKSEKVVVLQQYMSISHLQRMLRIGYNEAFRIAERLEKNGIIARAKNSSAWVVLKKKIIKKCNVCAICGASPAGYTNGIDQLCSTHKAFTAQR